MASASTTARVHSSVPAPTAAILTADDIFDETGRPREKMLLEHFKQEGRITCDAAIRILREVTSLFRAEPNLLQVPSPVTIVGDIHGQFYDLVKLFGVGGSPDATRYLFLGDYVDRGYFSMECVLYLWCLKLCYPDTMSFLRGNHECRHLTEYFTFKREVEFKYSAAVYDECMKSFDALPLAAIMDKQFFCVHGGISPELMSPDNIMSLDRFVEPEESGLLCDLLWSDPHEDFDKDTGSSSFLHNETRGCSYVYTHKAVCDFLDRNKLLSVIRAHEAQDQGYRMYKTNPKTGFPSVITIFSAPNYLDVYNNKAAVMIYQNNAMNIKKFGHTQHPYWLPNFLDVFTWSLPFIGEKTTEMLDAVMNVCSKDELSEKDAELDELASKMKAAKNAVRTRRQSYTDQARSNFGSLKLHGVTSPTGDQPAVDIDGALRTFEGVKALDKVNEAMPSEAAVRRAKQFRKRQTLEDISL
eukprot:m.85913 g.85913  ORF g.85913 m.85913 type:complete len:470 (+) comp8412_c0_seq1:521-1930(+)